MESKKFEIVVTCVTNDDGCETGVSLNGSASPFEVGLCLQTIREALSKAMEIEESDLDFLAKTCGIAIKKQRQANAERRTESKDKLYALLDELRKMREADGRPDPT